MSGTRLNNGDDMAVREDEHKLIELDYAIKVFRDAYYTVYSPEDVVEKLKSINPYTTVERIDGLRQTAIGAATEQRRMAQGQQEMCDGLVKKVRHHEDDIVHLKKEIEATERMYSRLKERFHQVKQENRNLRNGNYNCVKETKIRQDLERRLREAMSRTAQLECYLREPRRCDEPKLWY